jgi:hypothetical protein
MLPSFYQTHLQKYLSDSQLLTLNLLVALLQTYKQVRIERLAATLPIPIKQNSRRRHLQRFLTLNRLSVVLLWFPIIQEIVKLKICPGNQLIIAIDRTQWPNNNLFMASVIIQKRAFPVFWLMLNKKGSSNFREQQTLLRPVIRLFKSFKIVIVGDREFHSVELAQWLQSQKCYFALRQKKETTFRKKRASFQALSTLEIRPGERRFYRRVYWTQTRQSCRFNLAVYWKRKYRKKQQQEPWYILTNLPNLEETIRVYRQRFGIEAMFSDCKSGGYNLAGSQASPEKLTRLILLIALAMTSAWLKGDRTQSQGLSDYICRPQESRRNRRRHSNFWRGLYAHNWIAAFGLYMDKVEEIIKLVSDNRTFYHRGLKAIKLIQQPL